MRHQENFWFHAFNLSDNVAMSNVLLPFERNPDFEKFNMEFVNDSIKHKIISSGVQIP